MIPQILEKIQKIIDGDFLKKEIGVKEFCNLDSHLKTILIILKLGC